VAEESTADAQTLLSEDPVQTVWWASEVECFSALSRMERDELLTRRAWRLAVARLEALKSRWHEVQPNEQIRQMAKRLLSVHPLRAADALQLSAAVAASEQSPWSLGFISFDERLLDAARKEGLAVIGWKI
jgi:predicted nucleic acid-binding protein